MCRRRSQRLTVKLLDGEAVHRAKPRSFSIPRRAVRETLPAGDLVKLGFVIDPPEGTIEVERMWVEIVRAGDGGYTGRLDNEPTHVKGIKLNDEIDFGPEHVIARYAPPTDPLYTDPALFAVVSREVWDADAWPTQVERRQVPDPAYSGWFVFAGTESADFVADASNFVPIRAAQLFQRFRVLDSALEGPVGTRLTWSDADAEFRSTT
jgi:hypothetical protein